MLEDQDAVTRPNRSKNAISGAIIDVLEAHLPSLAVLHDDISSDEEDWTFVDLVEIAFEERVGVKRRLRDLQDSYRNERRMVTASVAEAVGLALELVGLVDVPPSPGM